MLFYLITNIISALTNLIIPRHSLQCTINRPYLDYNQAWMNRYLLSTKILPYKLQAVLQLELL